MAADRESLQLAKLINCYIFHTGGILSEVESAPLSPNPHRNWDRKSRLRLIPWKRLAYIHSVIQLLIPLGFLCRNPANYKIVVGDHNRNTNEGTEETVGAKRIISHPQYNKPSQINNDIALIQLAGSVKLSQRVNPICLPSHDSDVPTGSKCYITGESR